MNKDDIKRKNKILIKYLQSLNLNDEFTFKGEFQTDSNTEKVVVVQETSGSKIVFYGNATPLFNYYSIQVFGLSISESKSLSADIGNLIGISDYINVIYNDPKTKKKYNEKWQIIFQQYSNPQPIEYLDIRRVGYTATLKCIVNLVSRKEIENNN
jgi:hypothetical protein